MLRDLRSAASFLTRVPLHDDSADPPVMSRAVPWFPVVGLVLGGVQALLYWGLFSLLTPLLAASLSVAALALVTGAFHHDGLADIADAFGGGWSVEQRMEILKDSRLGTYGVTALVLVVLVEVSALASLAPRAAAIAVVSAHTLSRATAAATMVVSKPAASSGLGVDYLAALSRRSVVLCVVGAVVVCAVGAGVWTLAMVAAAGVGAAAVVGLANAKIGGISGDVLGAVQQVSKLAVLVVVVAVATSSSDFSGPLHGQF
jgi:adenosylcobinamide-GDP ribazoletransferase